MDWEFPKSKKVLELEKENQNLYEEIFKLEKKFEDLRFQLSASDVIIAEYEGKVLSLKQQIKELMDNPQPSQN